MADTVARWNELVTQGHDADYRRGESAHDHWWGDPMRKGMTYGGPGGTLGPGKTFAYRAGRHAARQG